MNIQNNTFQYLTLAFLLFCLSSFGQKEEIKNSFFDGNWVVDSEYVNGPIGGLLSEELLEEMRIDRIKSLGCLIKINNGVIYEVVSDFDCSRCISKSDSVNIDSIRKVRILPDSDSISFLYKIPGDEIYFENAIGADLCNILDISDSLIIIAWTELPIIPGEGSYQLLIKGINEKDTTYFYQWERIFRLRRLRN